MADQKKELIRSLRGFLSSVLQDIRGKRALVVDDNQTQKSVDPHALFESDLLTELNLVMDSIKQLSPIPTHPQQKATLDASEFLQTLEGLKSFAHKKRPKNCEPFLEKLFSMDLPNDTKRDIENIGLHIKKYRFKDAMNTIDILLAKQTPLTDNG